MQEIIIADIISSCNEYGQCVGHYQSLAQQYVDVLSPTYDVRIAGGPVYSTTFPEGRLIKLPCNCGRGYNHFVNLLRMIKNSIALFRMTRGKIVILQYGLPFSTHIAVLLGYRRCRLFMIEYSDAGVDKWYKKIVYYAFKRKVNGILCPNDSVGKSFRRPFCSLPDYIYANRNETCISKPFSERLIDFCVVGRISPEKGVIEIARKFAGTKYRVVIAGLPQTKELEEELTQICSSATNMELDFSYISDNKYRTILSNSKYAILNYRGEYSKRSSGVVFDVLFNDVPVIGSRCGALTLIEETGTGCLYERIELFEPSFLFDESLYNKYISNISEYKRINTLFIAKLVAFLRTNL